jgi:hypothetical protein
MSGQWILFAKWPSRDNCIGKGKIIDCDVRDDGTLDIDMTLDGVRYVGTLRKPYQGKYKYGREDGCECNNADHNDLNESCPLNDDCCKDEGCGCGNHNRAVDECCEVRE